MNLWDAASSGVAPRPIPEGAADGGTTAVERTRDRGQLRAAFLHSQRALAILERERDTEWYCAQDPAMPYWELEPPLMTLIQWWMEENGSTSNAARTGHERLHHASDVVAAQQLRPEAPGRRLLPGLEEEAQHPDRVEQLGPASHEIHLERRASPASSDRRGR